MIPNNPKPPLPTRRWLAPEEAAEYLGVSVPTLKQLGVKPSTGLGPRTPRYDKQKLDQEMADGAETPFLTEQEAAKMCKTTAEVMHELATTKQIRAMKALDGDGFVFLDDWLFDYMEARVIDSPA